MYKFLFLEQTSDLYRSHIYIEFINFETEGLFDAKALK